MASPLNGKTGEAVRWAIGLALAGLISYFTTVGKVAVVEKTQELQFNEVMRRLGAVENKQDAVIAGQRENNQLFEMVVRDWANGVNKRTNEPLPLQSAIDRGQR